MRTWIIVAAIALASTSATDTHQSAGDAFAGYVVEIRGEWEAVEAGREPERLAAGTGIRPGARLRLRSGSNQQTAHLAVVLFATGQIVTPRPGETIDAGLPKATGTLQRILAAVKRRVSEGSLERAAVRSDTLAQDAALLWTGGREWRRILGAIAPGPYIVRFRRLTGAGTPDGDWTAAAKLEVTAQGISPESLEGVPGPGLWQLSIRHQRTPSLSGEAWILLTTDQDAVAAFNELHEALGRSNRAQEPHLRAATQRLRRAALLALVK